MTTSPNTAEPQGAGFPDVDVLARLANELFRTVPLRSAPAEAEVLPPRGGAQNGLDDRVAFSHPDSIAGGVGAGGSPPLAAAFPPSPGLSGPIERTGSVPAIGSAVRPTALSSVAGRGSESTPRLAGFPGVSAPFAPALDDASLRALLPPASVRSAPQLPAGSASFYFLEHGRPDATRIAANKPVAPHLSGVAPLDVHLIRRDFPILSERVNGKQLIWLDNAA